MKKFVIIAVCFIVYGCTRPDSASMLLEKEGYTNIEITGYSWFGCSRDDWFHTGFRAKKNGNVIEGTVCEGLLFKNKTIRYE